jgi:hypothetical protein
MKIVLHVPEVHINKVAVEENSLDEAVAKVDAGDIKLEDVIGVEYSHTLDSDQWKVELPGGDVVSIENARAALAGD